MTEGNSSAATAATAIPASGKAPASIADSATTPDFKATKHKLKIDGQDMELDYDDLVRRAQKSTAADKRFQEAKRLHDEASKVRESSQSVEAALAKGDLSYLVNKLGPQKAKEVFENFLIEQMEYDQLPPAEKRARELQRRLDDNEAERKAETEDRTKEARALATQKAMADLDADISEALKADGKKPTPRLVLRILDELEAPVNARGQKITASQAKEKAIEGIHRDIGEYLPGVPVDVLIKILPKEVLQKLREYEVEQVLGDTQKRRVRVSQNTVRRPKEPETQSQWFARMDKKLVKQK